MSNDPTGFNITKTPEQINNEKLTSTHEYLEQYKKMFFEAISNKSFVKITAFLISLIKWSFLLILLCLLLLYIIPFSLFLEEITVNTIILYRNTLQELVKTVLAGGSLGQVFYSIFGKKE